MNGPENDGDINDQDDDNPPSQGTDPEVEEQDDNDSASQQPTEVSNETDEE